MEAKRRQCSRVAIIRGWLAERIEIEAEKRKAERKAAL